MGLRTRMLGALLLLGGACGVVFLLTGTKGDEASASSSAGAIDGAVPRFQSGADCRPCHEGVWKEWSGSHHQIAYVNPEVRKLSEDFRIKDCQDCHLPRPVATTGYGQRVLPRQTFAEQGVDCLACHAGADGAIVGRHAAPDAPCRVRADAAMVTPVMCKSCHNQHFTTDQWAASSFAKSGQDCASCHMPVVERHLADGRVVQGRDHRFVGCHDKAMLQKAGRFDVRRERNQIVMTLTNVGAGHNYPTEERSRAVDMMVRFVRADGTATAWQRLWRCRQPYRDEPGDNTQLLAGASKQVEVPIPAGAVRAEARLWYRLAPYIGDEDPLSTLLEERSVALR
jgi:Cytochrome c554 and c-prime